MVVADVTSVDEERMWDAYVLDHPFATGYHLVAWRRVMEEAFGHRTVYLMAKDVRGVVRGVLPLVLLSSKLFGRFLVSMPFVNYGGVLCDSSEGRDLILDVAIGTAKEEKVAHVELRHQDRCDLVWPRREHKVSVRVELPEQAEMLWKSFPAKLRSQIRRAQKEGLTAHIGGLDALDDFYQVFSRNMRDLGTPVYGRQFFETILRIFPKEARIIAVCLHDQPVAAGLLFGFRQMLEIPWASSDRRYNCLAPNMLLYWSVMEFACREGFRMFDFGRSTPGSGTYQFKMQWGAEPTPLYWYYWSGADDQLPELSSQSRKYRIAVNIWRKLPIALTRVIGPHIVKHLPFA